ncbi:MAG: DUF2156 domain-containing protein [Nitrospirae bacterium]|nr:DUF2156 domain-containing protein [Nitrospirota bacterium]
MNDNQTDNLLQELYKYGDRTSSFISLYPHFKSYKCDEGCIRYLETDGAWIAAAEPLTPKNSRADAFKAFAVAAASAGKSAVILPIGKQLADELRLAGFDIMQSGVEPIFNLSDYFNEADPLNHLQVAKSLKLRGAKISELSWQQCSEALQKELESIYRQWLEAKDNQQLSFLSISDPFQSIQLKKLFVLEAGGKAQAFLTAVPYYNENHEIAGYYFADWIRADKARAGSIELLMVEAMRILLGNGIKEARLGNCALAKIESKGAAAAMQRLVYKLWSWKYNFKTLYEFKAKLKPSRWDRLYIASNANKLKTLYETTNAHFLTKEHNFINSSILSALTKIKWTLMLSVLCVAVHILKVNTDIVLNLYLQSAYIPGDVTLKGLFLGPLFHNHLRHLFGDQLSLLFFGSAIEWIFGPRLFWILVVFGLWLSNPITHMLLGTALPLVTPEGYSHFLIDKDYGSSNAVYSLVGGLSAKISRPAILILPFALNGVIVCYERQSLLALHHHISLLAGWMIVKYFLSHKSKKI